MVIGEEKVLPESPFTPGTWWKLWGPTGEVAALVPGEKILVEFFRVTGSWEIKEVSTLQVGLKQGFVVRGQGAPAPWVFAVKAGRERKG